MDNNIYGAPISNLSEKPEARGSLLQGLILGLLIDIVGTMIVGAIYGAGRAMYLMSTGMSADDVVAKLSKINLLTFEGAATTSIGLFMSFFAAYICAKRSGKSSKYAVITLGTASISFGIYYGLDKYSFAENFILSIITAAAIYLGYLSWIKTND